MADVTLRVLDGADRGRVYDHLVTPVTIGREEGNSVQLNDERISRFHIKIQEDQDKIVQLHTPRKSKDISLLDDTTPLLEQPLKNTKELVVRSCNSILRSSSVSIPSLFG